jgi:hypothetical protein
MDHNIMDYSLLIGVHNKVIGNTSSIRTMTLSTYKPTPEAISRRATASSRSDKAAAIKKGMQDLVSQGPSTALLADSIPDERRYCIFYADNGGFGSTYNHP